MGQMKQMWTMPNVTNKINSVTAVAFDEGKLTDALFDICMEVANAARTGHSYRNVKGELESSTGVVVLKDRENIKKWAVQSESGKDPARGIADFKRALDEFIIGKSELPDGTQIPAKGLIGIVFAAAPYAGLVESKGRTVLDSFTPESGYIFTILKSAMANEVKA